MPYDVRSKTLRYNAAIFLDPFPMYIHLPYVLFVATNLLAPELFFFILAQSVYKMWIIQEPNKLELWNKLHFEEEKNGEYIPRLKYSVPIFIE